VAVGVVAAVEGLVYVFVQFHPSYCPVFMLELAVGIWRPAPVLPT
jgi:hypothetical protein